MSAPAVTTFSFLAQAPAPAPAGASPDAGGGSIQFLIPILIVAGIYYIIFAPHLKKQKEHCLLYTSVSMRLGSRPLKAPVVVDGDQGTKGDRVAAEAADNVL